MSPRERRRQEGGWRGVPGHPSAAGCRPGFSPAMPDAAKAELLRALGRSVRGLSTLFWGLALTGLVYLEMVYLETGQMDLAGDIQPAGLYSRAPPKPACLARPEPTARLSGAGTDLAARLEPRRGSRGARCRPGPLSLLVAPIPRRSAFHRLRGAALPLQLVAPDPDQLRPAKALRHAAG